MLTSGKTYTLPVVQGRGCGMGQRQAKRGMHGLLPALRAALRALGDAPARALTALAQRRRLSEAAAAPVGTPLAAARAPGGGTPAATPDAPFGP
jgi:hypothetical protein